MKKYAFVLLIMSLTIVAVAATSLTISIPDIHSALVLSAINCLADKDITINAYFRDDPGNPTIYECQGHYNYAPKDPNETNKAFVKRALKSYIIAMVELAESSREHQRYRDEVAAIEQPDVNVPSGIVE